MGQSTASQTRGFLFADLREYTRFVERHGDQAAADLLARYRVLVREAIGRFDGAEIRTEGDSFYVVFTSASAAINGGIAILEAAAASGESGRGAIQVGVGVHAGETAETPEGLVGSAVNLAARICALAGPGELWVSDTVRGLTRTFLPVRFVPRGRRRLKGIAEPVLLYQVMPMSPEGAYAAETPARRLRRGWPRLAAIAVGAPLALLAVAGIVGVMTGVVPFGPNAGSSPAAGRSAIAPSPSAVIGSTTGQAGGLTPAEEELRAKLPGAFGEGCVPASVAEGSAGGSPSLRCELPLSAAVDEVWVDQFPSPETLAGAFGDEVARVQAPAGDCDAGPLGRGPWEVPNVHAGQLLCYQQDGAVWLVWTYDDERIMVRARRGGDDWSALHAWWRETAIFLR